MSCIQEQAAALTRRSAGLPAMITSILSAYPGGNFFDKVMQELQLIAKLPLERRTEDDRLRLPQVHALNCLKDVFTNTRLGPSTESHIESTLEIAMSCLNHET